MAALLQVRELTVEYRDGHEISPVAKGVSFDVAAGEALGFLGESGCGKTTIALAILGMLPANGSVVNGSIEFRGRKLLSLNESEWQRIRGAEMSLIFQEPALALNPVMRVGDQIAEVLRAHRTSNRFPWRAYNDIRPRVLAMLAEVQLPAEIYSAYPHQLSGGQRQRIVIAQALACRPELVIADEPTASLDSTTQAEILALLKGLKDRLGVAFIFISHNPAMLQKIADRVAVFSGAGIVEEGATTKILRQPVHPYTRSLLSSLPRIPYQLAGQESSDSSGVPR
jgi:ABC-type glutathione transport system ATPase component